jgi:hypothetical protein
MFTTGTLGDIYPDFASYIPSKLAQTKFMEFLREGKSKWYSKTILYHC